MQCYTQLTPPTAVTHSLSLPFLSPSANNLVIAKTSLLQIFSLKSVLNDVESSVDQKNTNATHENRRGSTQRTERVHTTKLILVAQYECPGTITSIARVKILQSRSGGEALLFSLQDAKLSLVEWDPETYSISTISIHYYERDNLLGGPWMPDLGRCVNYLSVDPSSRCAALKFGARHLAILPFRQTGDELVMDEYDPNIDGERHDSLGKIKEAADSTEKTPYAASFVLSLLALDPNLSHPLHLAFLYEYREPTFGIISSQVAISTALLHERRDTVSYSVFTLDLEQRASTTLLTVTNLPYDLFAVIPLRLPVGGALLIGGNELIHVDQAGKTTGVAVNEFAKQSSAFAMADQSDLALRLEYCVVEQLGLDNRELLLVLNTGGFVIITFKIDGRSVSGLSIRRVTQQNGGTIVKAGSSCTSMVGRGRMFVGSESADSVILGWSRRSDKPKRQRSRLTWAEDEMLGVNEEDIEDEDDDVDDDDLYSGTKADDRGPEHSLSSLVADSGDDYVFRIHDSLQNYGPMTDIALRNLAPFGVTEPAKGTSSGLELTVSSGRGRAGGLTTFTKNVDLRIVEQYDILGVSGVWAICANQTPEETSVQYSEGGDKTKAKYDKYVIVSRNIRGEQLSNAYKFTATGPKEVKDTNFDPEAGATVEVGCLNSGNRIVQVLPGELKTFDGDFGLAQICPMTDDITGTESKVISASFADPYVILIRDDFSILVLKADEKGDLDEVEQGDLVLGPKWLSGSLFEDSNDIFRLETDDDSEDEAGNVLAFLLSKGGGLHVFRLPNLKKPAYVADGLSFLPPFLSAEFTVRRSSAREYIKEVLVAELGDAISKYPYLILRSESDDLVIYQPYQSPIGRGLETALRFLKISTLHMQNQSTGVEYHEAQEKERWPLRLLPELGEFSALFVPGASPCLVFKYASSPPKIVGLGGGTIYNLCQFNSFKCERGFLYADEKGLLQAAQLPLGSQYSTGWVTRRTHLGEEVQALDYHQRQESYVLGTSQKIDFKVAEDEFHNDTGSEEATFLPQIDQGSIKLLDRKTWSIIDKHELHHAEIVMCVKTMSLETSEHTPSRREVVVVGSAMIRGEDLPSQGRIYIFDIIDVVPEPDRPETSHKLKLIAEEEVKGAVTALSPIGSQGFLLVAQGQKCLVRGLKEDGSLLPVAFMDMQCYVTVAKELEGTGLCITGDAVKGIWLTGYYEEPYQLRLFGKSPHHIEVITADFLPDGKQLYIVVADADCNIHILQFDPENPKSLSGQRLLHLTTFHTGHFPTTLTLLPSRSLLLTSATGALALISTLPPSTHRTLSALQSHLQNTLPHPLGLNPRAYRATGDGRDGGAALIDGGLVARWAEGGSWKRWEGGGGEVSALVAGLGHLAF